MSKELALYKPVPLPELPNTIEPKELLEHNKCLSAREIEKVNRAWESKLYDMAAEYIWNRTIAILKGHIMQYGTDFVAEMLDRSETVTPENISNHEVIHLAHNLAFINKAAYIELNQFDEIFTYYWSDLDEDQEKNDLSATKSLDITRACIQYVLRFSKSSTSASSFTSFRDRFKFERINKDDVLLDELKVSSYFYIRTIIRTLLNLSKSIVQGAELENVLSNLVLILTEIWDTIQSEEKYLVGRAYVQASADGKKPLMSALRSVLMQVQGFDYVPENLRSNSYIRVAKNLLTTHYSLNNFYNEPAVAKELMQMGTSIPSPALGACLTSVLACKIGNSYGISTAAQKYLDEILNNISKDRWEYYLNQVLPYNSDILSKISNSGRQFERWLDIINAYELNKLSIKNADIEFLLDENNRDNPRKVQKRAYDMYSKLNEDILQL